MDRVRKAEYIQYCEDASAELDSEHREMLKLVEELWDTISDARRIAESILNNYSGDLVYDVRNPETYSWFNDNNFPRTPEGDIEVDRYYDAYESYMEKLKEYDNDLQLVESAREAISHVPNVDWELY